MKSPFFMGLVVIMILAVFLGTITEDILENGSLVRLDQWVLDRTSAFHHRALDYLMIAVTNLGGGRLIWPLTILTVYFFLRWRRKFEAGFVTAVMAGGWVLGQVLKETIRRARPVPPSGAALTDAWGWSYPSGHALLAVLFYFTAAYLIWRRSGPGTVGGIAFAGAFLLSVLIALSRVYLQVHYLSDVIAGLLAGLLWLAVCILLAGRYR